MNAGVHSGSQLEFEGSTVAQSMPPFLKENTELSAFAGSLVRDRLELPKLGCVELGL